MMKLFKKNETASIGIGAMIVFIAMVLVAGIAASVLIQTSTTLESQAMATGTQTTQEVAGGVAVYGIEGRVATDIEALAITVRPRAGSPNIDLNQTVLLLSDGTKKVVLTFDYADTAHFNATVSATDGDIFGVAYSDLTNEEFGILVLNDPDSSLSSRTSVVMNRGDKVILTVDATACFGGTGLAERTDVFGYIYPEHGSPGVIAFRTPASYSDTIYTLQ